MEIKRDVYLTRLIQRKHNRFIKVITGLRRSGKSYLMNTLFYNHLIASNVNPNHIIRFAFDSSDDLIKIGEDVLLLDNTQTDKKIDPKKFLAYLNQLISDNERYYLLLDEIQHLGAFEAVLNSFLRKDNLDVYVSGSNSKFLSKDILTEFAGRGDEIHVLPLTFSEFFNASSKSKEDAFEEYVIYGGLPAITLMKTDEEKSLYLMRQMKHVYLQDIVQRYNLADDSAINELLDVIASGISTLTNPTKIAATFISNKKTTISPATIDKYITHMEDAFMLNRVKRFDVKGRKYIGTPYKIYFEDIGLRNARLNFRQIESTHLMKNIIYNELRFRGFHVDVGVVESREKDASGKEIRKQLEIDFIATQGYRKYYIQSAYAIRDEEKYNQETKGFRKIDDNFKKIILVEKNMSPRYSEQGYLMMGVKEFLLDANSLNI